MAGSKRKHLVRFARVAVSVTLLLTLTLTTTPAPAVGTCVTKPDIVPVGDLTPGEMATADTVVSGRTIVSFDVEILGVLPDAIAPGVDLILVHVSGPVIDATGGIAFGMSGSPVYVGGKLVGSISYGLGSGSDHTIGGVTPARYLLDIMDYPAVPAAMPVRVPLTPALRQVAADAAGVPTARIPSSLQPLEIPAVVSGLDARARELFQRQLDRKGLPVRLFPGGSVKAPAGVGLDPAGLVPGSSFASIISYGDLTFGGIGTTTAVCGHVVMGWGHPFYRSGETNMGMSAADIITVVKDPSDVWGPFKMGTIAETYGTVDQDRLTGMRGIDGQMPALVPVTSHMENPDLGKVRDGETDVVWQEVLPDVAAMHTMSNLDVVYDISGGGSSSLAWDIKGTRANGDPFELRWNNMYYSDWDISYGSIWDLYEQLGAIAQNPFEKVKFTSVDVDGSVTQENLATEITDVWSASTKQPVLQPRALLKAKRGDKITLRVFLHPLTGPDYSVDILYKIPRWVTGKGPLAILGGYSGSDYYYDDGSSGTSASFDELLAQLTSGTRNNDIVVLLFPPGPLPSGGSNSLPPGLDERHYQQDRLVSGQWVFGLAVKK